jgi:hypothetical protein
MRTDVLSGCCQAFGITLTISLNNLSRLRELWLNRLEMSYRQLSSFILSSRALFSSGTFFMSKGNGLDYLAPMISRKEP